MADESVPLITRSHRQNPQLKVVFDTSVLHIDSASNLVRPEIATLLRETAHRDLHVLWYLPDVARHERQYQMQKKALELHSLLNRVERFLGPQFTVQKEMFIEQVRKAVGIGLELGFLPLRVDATRVDWQDLMLNACYRRAPFEEGDTEKGFRDALLGESFLQLVADSPKAADLCRVVLVTSDALLASAVKLRISAVPNAAVLSSVQELKGLINVLSSDVDEAFVARLQSRAARLFFVPGESRDTLYYTEDINGRLIKTFAVEFESVPPDVSDTAYRKDGQWWINEPAFVKKEVTRVFWSSRIDVETEAINLTIKNWPNEVDPTSVQRPMNALAIGIGEMMKPSFEMAKHFSGPLPVITRTVSHKGMDSYEIIWSVEVTMSEELGSALIEDMRHIGVNWESVTG